MKNIDIPIFAIDFEGSEKIGIVEYGIAEIANAAVQNCKTAICAPKRPISKRDSEFFGIGNKEASKFAAFEENAHLFCEMRMRGILCSHNSLVEDSFLRGYMPSPGLSPNFTFGGKSKDWAPWLDTCALARNIYPYLKSAKLSDLIEEFGLMQKLQNEAEKFCPQNRRKWHCALFDALASALLLIEICTQKGFENVDLPWLVKYSSASESIQGELFR